jgi:hypothetical protein
MATIGANMINKNQIDKAMPAKGSDVELTERLKNILASETSEEETELMLLQEALQDEDYRNWKHKNPGGSFKDYIDQFKPKRIKLADGTSEEYSDLIDAYEKGIDVMVGESLTQYIKRIKAAEKDRS